MDEKPYDKVNAGWERDELPAISKEEARRAARRLIRHFAKRSGSRWVRRCWISRRPVRGIRRGWARLVHDVSHRVYSETNRWDQRSHCRSHAELELAMVEFVRSKGWLGGALLPVKSVARPVDRVGHARTMAEKWARKAASAGRRSAKWRKRAQRLERLVARAA